MGYLMGFLEIPLISAHFRSVEFGYERVMGVNGGGLADFGGDDAGFGGQVGGLGERRSGIGCWDVGIGDGSRDGVGKDLGRWLTMVSLIMVGMGYVWMQGGSVTGGWDRAERGFPGE